MKRNNRYLCTVNLSHPVVLFDGVCNFCNNSVNFAIRNDKNARLKFAPLQSATGRLVRSQFKIPETIDTVILIDKGKVYTFAKAAIRICKYLDWPAKFMYVLIIFPSFISQPVYKWIARNRYRWFGKKDSCMVPTQAMRERFLS